MELAEKIMCFVACGSLCLALLVLVALLAVLIIKIIKEWDE